AGDFEEAKNNGDDFQFGFLPGNFADIPPRATVFVPGVSTSKLRQIELAFTPIEGGYRGEIKIPWVVFGEYLDLSNKRLGVALAFSDCDSEQPAQEMMISTAPKSISQWGNPVLWNNLDLK
ncbi:MAG: sugar-binding protein, partial [Anaerolineales bacterium]